MRPRWKQYLADIVQAIDTAQTLAKDVDEPAFMESPALQGAVAYQLIIIGEAATHLPPWLTAQAPEVPWSDVRDMRNQLVHRYWARKLRRIWDTLVADLPLLRTAATRLMAATEPPAPDTPDT